MEIDLGMVTPIFMADPNVVRSLDPVVTWLHNFHQAYPVVGVLCVLAFVDVICGYGAAFVTKTISSSVCWKGMVRKVMMFLLIGTCAAIEPYAGDMPLSKMAGMAFILVEFTSIIENAARAGVPIPEVITDTLAKIKAGNKASVQKQPPQQVHIDKASNVDLRTHDSVIVLGREEEKK